MEAQDNRKYFVSWYRLDGQDRYLIWWTGDYNDAVWVDAKRQIPVFTTIGQAQDFARQRGIPLETAEPELQNLDWVKHWLQHPTSAINTEECLMGWNFFIDVADGTGRPFAGQRGKIRKAWRGKIYDKLFFGTSTGMLLAPEGTARYIPRWNKAEKKFLAKVLTQGLRIFREHMQLL
ncbi:hypothetical protein E5K00_00755 [Hymenobacter aquaticus]|uniref:Uncharacterized protein n=1 Tax=Hymenobacter aquaticus TaxID=1867101 RepID=A0A4Z0Q1C0_9BACT|nr:hypothetical protein [Hymenobacter aquaticus]TGE23777.1 hypothetical protein E5K00_00755 [Hymenobacter aquaticus]